MVTLIVPAERAAVALGEEMMESLLAVREMAVRRSFPGFGIV